MISVQEAEAIIKDSIPAKKSVNLKLADVYGYILAEPLYAERDHPPFDRVMRDGIAIMASSFQKGCREFHVSGFAAAGAAQIKLDNPLNCIEVATGAPLPAGCDTIISYEDILIRENIARINDIITSVKTGQAVHYKGSDARAEQILLDSGIRIDIPAATLLASNGMADVKVFKKPQVGILTTGDELVAIDGAVAPYQIRRSNDLTLAMSLRANGYSAKALWARDDKDDIRRHLETLLDEDDLIIITGGISRGATDYVPEILRELDVQCLFHNVAQRPGKPMWYGIAADGKPVFGLPGNPVSCLVCLTRYVLPALSLMSGMEPKSSSCNLASDLQGHADLTLFAPVSIENKLASSHVPKGSGDFTSLHGSTGFVELTAGDNAYVTGCEVPFYPWVSNA